MDLVKVMNQATNVGNKTARITQVVSNLRFKPYDTTSEEGRARERQRRIAWTVIAAVGAKAIALTTSLVSIRLTFNYLGEERFGMWAMLSSLISLLTFTDLGIGNGLLNAISDANGKDNQSEAQQYVSSAFFMLLGLTASLFMVFLVLYPLVNWSGIFNVSSRQAVAESTPVMTVFFACILINIPIGIIQRIQLGYQEGFANSLWLAVGNVLSLCGILSVIHFQAGLPFLVLALMGTPILAQMINGVVLFGYHRRWLVPRFRFFSTRTARHILKLGFLFFILQAATAIGFQSDSLVIAQFLGANEVAQYAVPMRLFSIITILLGILLQPLWPAYGEALARQDVIWVKSVLRKSLLVSAAIAVPMAIFLVIFGKVIVKLWVSEAVEPTTFLLEGMGAWTVLYSLLNPLAMFLNGASIVKFQVITASTMAVMNLTLSIFLVQRIGVAGVIWGTVISLLICTLFPTLYYIFRYLNDSYIPEQGRI